MGKIFLLIAIVAGALWTLVLKGGPTDRLAILGAVAALPLVLLGAELIAWGGKGGA
jgi:hypothetical protein